jgi:hypothetical protein
MDAGDGRRRKSCPPCRNKGSRGLVRYVSYSRSMLSMCTSASMCCLGLAKVFCIVVGMKGVECCGGSCCLTLKHEGRITPTPLPSPQPPRARRLDCRWQGYGKVQKYLGGSSVWSVLGPPAACIQRRLSARPYESCRARAKTRRVPYAWPTMQA